MDLARAVALLLFLAAPGCGGGAPSSPPTRGGLGARALDDLPEPAPGPARGARVRPRDDAAERALGWLAAHQRPEGRIEGAPDHDVAVTALALLAFLELGTTDRGDHAFAGPVGRAAAWLRGAQDERGFLFAGGGERWRLDHALGTWALVTLYGQTLGLAWRGAAERALAALASLREDDGLWRYGLGTGAADESLTLWALLALSAGRRVALEERSRGRPPLSALDADPLVAAGPWIERLCDPIRGTLRPDLLGETRLPVPGADPTSLTAGLIWLRLLRCEERGPGSAVARGAELLLSGQRERAAASRAPVPLELWLMREAGWRLGPAWRKGWEETGARVLLGLQGRSDADPEADGSFPVATAWERSAGRGAATALGALALAGAGSLPYDSSVPGCPPPAAGVPAPAEADAAPPGG